MFSRTARRGISPSPRCWCSAASRTIQDGQATNRAFFTAALDVPTWGAELAAGEGCGRIYIVQPSGDIEDDPNVTDRRFPGIQHNPSAVASRCA